MKAQFIDYQQSDEYDYWAKVVQKKKDYPDIDKTTMDLNGPWQVRNMIEILILD